MISFVKLGEHGWFGNQIFQYAYLRSQARRLGVKFCCPPWQGDEVFELNDEAERVRKPGKISRIYRQPKRNCGFEEKALKVRDGTDVRGYFQSARYFDDPETVRGWFRFKEGKIRGVRQRWEHVDLSRSVGLHLRFREKQKVTKHRLRYCLPRGEYYRRALEIMSYRDTVLIFSDDLAMSRKWLSGIPGNFVFVEGNQDYEDLYLMTQCHGLVCSVSTFCWWGAWLNRRPDRRIVVPQEGHFRSGHAWKCRDYWCDDWIPIPGADRFWDHYQTQFWLGWLRHFGVAQLG
ncbi:MAG: alpha-1,2-fucosyltransferase [Candidatus Omnitrophota bacterium]